MRGACFTENVLYYARISCDDKTYNPKLYNESAKKHLKNVTQIIKNLLMRKNNNDAKLSTRYWKLANKKLHHVYPGVKRQL